MEEWNAQTGSAPLERRLPLPPAVPNLFQFHNKNMSTALKALNEKGIPVVEYGQQIQFRWGWAEILVTVSEQGFALAAEPPTSGFPWEQWIKMGRFHNLDEENWNQVHLYPLSAVGIALDDTYEVLSTFDPKLRIRTPLPARYMLTMIRELVKYYTDEEEAAAEAEFLSKVEGAVQDIKTFQFWVGQK
ncbi:uncharacterized protein N7496_007802 [Penicillium cataractarum]|uniref:Uncharacterized protein n=1 Tax=Penicillium cataractarum TaxID=2100454 RepID=A0A9W9RXE8_9EURO|nr:uncharacterized protein N7496_007802 [Penicillium cataractarum]KAJ5368042.1 hypothetical protein N7496_007802 [Penicillium cataractarum]